MNIKVERYLLVWKFSKAWKTLANTRQSVFQTTVRA